MARHLTKAEIATLRDFVITRRRRDPRVSERRLHGAFVQAYPDRAWLQEPRFRYWCRRLAEEAKARGCAIADLPLDGQGEVPAATPAAGDRARELERALAELERYRAQAATLRAALDAMERAAAAKERQVAALVAGLAAPGGLSSSATLTDGDEGADGDDRPLQLVGAGRAPAPPPRPVVGPTEALLLRRAG
ncbi:MAG TPA: hypothetical protein VFL91_24005 [Thermomicrobiales bacterium]|nr:hypothetical protein [Thermomicrobiales bacterium]